MADSWKIGAIRDIVSGQQTNRLGGGKENPELKIRILSPSAIHAGFFDESQITDAYAKDPADIEQMHRLHKFTQAGDIIMKLSTPYEACLIGKMNEGFVVPSSCCIIRRFYSTSVPNVPDEYLCAALNSERIKSTIGAKMSGSKNPAFRVSDFKELIILNLGESMEKIGKLFTVSAENRQNLLKLIKEEERILNNLMSLIPPEESHV